MEAGAMTGLRAQILANGNMLASHCRKGFQPLDIEVIVHGTVGHFTALLVYGNVIAIEGGKDTSIMRALENLLMITAAMMGTVTFETSLTEHVDLDVEGVNGGRLNTALFSEETVAEAKEFGYLE
ncbi:Hypothetical protein R9X50_00502300 [Acrodontium crateriforme]|uniref:Uncharacterized protein n=1 Tax=Acrodontium crateriforme TaxID=150365 RepID=A0AAQ3M8L8_9PEZI|nr:Hypothetical protein R9X50_00502300 [Acrodontium crateriforme]